VLKSNPERKKFVLLKRTVVWICINNLVCVINIVTLPQYTCIRRVIEHGESLIGLDFGAFRELAPSRVRRHLGLLAWVLLLILFAVRASTLGAMKSAADVFVKDSKLCLVLRKIKWWIADRQGNRTFPLTREARYGIPFAEGGAGFRDRAVRIIMAAKHADCLLFLAADGFEGASRLFNESLREFGWLTDSPTSVSTSHSGRKTCIAAGSSLGVPVSMLREWMLVVEDKTVDTYAKSEANYEAGPVTRDLVGFLVNMV
jgi:hypothetical protein